MSLAKRPKAGIKAVISPYPETTKPECVHTLAAAARQILASMISYNAKEMPYTNTDLPADLEQFVQAKVRSGRGEEAGQVRNC